MNCRVNRDFFGHATYSETNSSRAPPCGSPLDQASWGLAGRGGHGDRDHRVQVPLVVSGLRIVRGGVLAAPGVLPIVGASHVAVRGISGVAREIQLLGHVHVALGGMGQVDEGVLLVGDPENVLREPALVGFHKSSIASPGHPKIEARLDPKGPRVVPVPILHLQRHQRSHRRPQTVSRDGHSALGGLGGVGVAANLLQGSKELGLQSLVG
mmetsp:Transcript_49207/g.111469  ORF Transcript_49207/g.111469 Transcript_49207/m.111469 type:complete len:211 (+) Transcript_49207:74-706(+)